MSDPNHKSSAGQDYSKSQSRGIQQFGRSHFPVVQRRIGRSQAGIKRDALSLLALLLAFTTRPILICTPPQIYALPRNRFDRTSVILAWGKGLKLQTINKQ